MLKTLTLFFFLSLSLICNSQNLVPNGGFEDYITCAVGSGDLEDATNWINPATGNNPGTPDYYDSCSNFSYGPAHNGKGYIALFLFQVPFEDIREYAEVKLTSKLVANTRYTFNMYVKLSDFCMYTTNTFGVYFSDTVIYYQNELSPLSNFNPQLNNPVNNIPDTLNWKLISMEYTAAGGEEYLVIGNFKADSGTNIIICNNSASDYTGGYLLIDDVSLTPSGSSGITVTSNQTSLNVFPNPFTTEMKITTGNNSPSEILLHDVTGRLVYSGVFENTISLNTSHFTPGIYFYEVKDKNGLVKNGKVIKM